MRFTIGRKLALTFRGILTLMFAGTKGSTEITQNIAEVSKAAQGTSSSAQESQKAANELAEVAARLRRLVEQFKIGGGKNEIHSKPVAQRLKTRIACASR